VKVKKIKNRTAPLGILALFSVAALYGLYGIFSRKIGSAFGNFGQCWLRNFLVALIVILIIFLYRLKLKPLRKKDFKWLSLWALSGSWVTVFTFIAFNHLKIGTVYLTVYSAMIISGYCSGKIFFKERTNPVKITSLILALGGLLVIYKFEIKPEEIIYLLLALFAGAMTGLWNTISKKFSDYYPNLQIVLMDALASTFFVFLGAVIFKEALPANVAIQSWLWLVIFALAQVATVGLVVYGFKNLEAQIGSLILPVEVIFALIFANLFFQESPTPTALIGSLLIIGAAVVPSLLSIFNWRLN